MKVLIIGGNRFFGKKLAENLLQQKHEVTLLNRGNLNADLSQGFELLKADRKNPQELMAVTSGKKWDLIFDQVCYSADEARQACEIFKAKTPRYIFTSSMSIYEDGVNLNENDFDSSSVELEPVADPKTNYQAAKRQAESVFLRQSEFEAVMVRMSLVVGMDDYTGRLLWHLKRIQQNTSVYFPNLEARLDFIRSDFAAQALADIGFSKHCGPVNCAAPGAIKIRELISLMEKALNREMVLSAEPNAENASPYCQSVDKFMDLSELHRFTSPAPMVSSWMPGLLSELAKPILEIPNA